MRITSLRSATLLFFHLFLTKFYRHANADVYLHIPRSSGNRLLQNSMNRENDDRVFELQNNAEEDHNALDKDINPNSNVNPAKGGKVPQLFEGDIVLTPDDIKEMKELEEGGDNGQSSPDITKRNARRNRKKLWVTKVIPYELPESLKARLEVPVKAAIKEYHNKTCLKFVRRTTEKNWIRFVSKSGCWSQVGKSSREGAQEVSLGPRCNYAGTVIHELMHALGFWHEQSRPDRDEYVEIFWENIKKDKDGNFKKYSHGLIDILGTNYDFESVMHYTGKSFSKNGQATIRAIKKPERTLGQRLRLSDTDVIKIDALYDCTDSGSGVWSPWSELSPCLSSCYKFRQRFCSSSDRAKDCPRADKFGIETEFVKCSDKECYAPVDGHWGRWSSWSACGSSCGSGKKQRTRKCEDPPSSYGGKNCTGVKEQDKTCLYKKCSLGPDDCDFDDEAGWCIWHNVNQSWYLHSGNTTSLNTGPESDNGGLKGGRYIYFESSSPVKSGEQGIVESKIFGPTQATCMSFYFSMYGDTMGKLTVYIQDMDKLRPQNNRRKVWEKIGNQGKSWQNSRITISSSSRFTMLFIATKGSSYRSDIALDDITFKNQPCLPSISTTTIPSITGQDNCNFDNGWCIWRNVNKLWYRQSGGTKSYRTGPTGDNSGLKGGDYIYFESSSPVKTGEQGIVESKIFGPTQATCMSFYFSMYGDTMGKLTVYIEDINKLQPQDNRKKVWEKIGNQGISWQNSRITISSNSPFKMLFIATKGSSYRSDIALDDITFKNQPCLPSISTTTIPSITGQDNCNFDNGWCIWRNVNKLWYRQSGGTKSYRTGPTGDNSGLKGGDYIYFESSSPVKTGEQGIVESKIFGPTQATCMSFYFSMYGDTMGKLTVYIEDINKLQPQNNRKKVWEKIGNQGISWKNSRITISSNSPFKILFIATKGSSYRSDIALDDITFKIQAC